ncbi:plasmid stabilization protein [Eggerthella guodeyinii]|uniref:Plasmid stabilization protein n=2 Tax=Eggerthella TaxID=84111 RepID=A0A6L7IWB7_9ACTN|nr:MULTISPECIES: plasmid stabilization protein [Eggerthella]MBC5585401.1 plasmid stabilization protein [Eggerthella hominis]QOS69436.1 plasmid stabilization protein [Eggerthella guodeyinii]
MPDLLIRNLDHRAKDALVARAAKNGRSQQAEARAILESALQPEPRDWVSMLRRAAASADGLEIEAPERHPARTFDAAGWL